MASSKKVIGSISETFEKGEFEWRINVCSSTVLELETGNYVTSPTFSFSSCSWYIRMYQHGNDASCVEWISLFLYKNICQSDKYISYSFAMTFQNIELPAKNDFLNYYFTKDGTGGYGWQKYILTKNVLDHWSKDKKSCCQLTIKIRLRDFEPQDEDSLLKVKNKGKEKLCQNYKDLFLHGKDHDLVIKVKDKEFRVHRNIMQCRCPVFKSMLESEMSEKNTGVVEIPDCDPVAFEQFLIHVYCGEPDVLDESTMLGLYFIADKYNMEDLKEECSIFIKKSLSANVVSDVIKLALNHSDTTLLDCAMQYFFVNAKRILVTVEWQSFMKENPVQANELFIKVVDKLSCCCVRCTEDSVTNLSQEDTVDDVAVLSDE